MMTDVQCKTEQKNRILKICVGSSKQQIQIHNRVLDPGEYFGTQWAYILFISTSTWSEKTALVRRNLEKAKLNNKRNYDR
jgi:hypothetical protein